MKLPELRTNPRDFGCAVLLVLAGCVSFYFTVGHVVFRRTRTDVADYGAALLDGAAVASVTHFPPARELPPSCATVWKRSSVDYFLTLTCQTDLGAMEGTLREWRSTALDQHTREHFIGYGEQYILYPWESIYGDALRIGPGCETIVLGRGRTDEWRWLFGVSFSRETSTIVYWSVSCTPD